MQATEEGLPLRLRLRAADQPGFVLLPEFASHSCLLRPGDLLVFDSHLLHRSTDNQASTRRAAMVWHFAAAGTRDRGIEGPDGRFVPSPVHDGMPVLRGGDPVIG